MPRGQLRRMKGLGEGLPEIEEGPYEVQMEVSRGWTVAIVVAPDGRAVRCMRGLVDPLVGNEGQASITQDDLAHLVAYVDTQCAASASPYAAERRWMHNSLVGCIRIARAFAPELAPAEEAARGA